jgi:hypothetical protein
MGLVTVAVLPNIGHSRIRGKYSNVMDTLAAGTTR